MPCQPAPPTAPQPAFSTDRMILAPPMPPQAGRQLPLHGLTVLAVEDSRFASDALRLLCQRSGARLRRAETLDQAQAHLRVYRPDLVLIDLGLPDGRGEDLIRALTDLGPDRPTVLGMSGDPDGRAPALAAGADGFLDKPLAGLAAFQQAVLSLRPDRMAEHSSCPLGDGTVTADPAALHDDLVLAALALGAAPDAAQRHYLAGFLSGLARQTQDVALSQASAALRRPNAGLQGLTRILDQRLADSAPFRPGAP
jgi:CheY-like chemotaxis protein